MNVQNMLPMSHRLVCSWIVQLTLGTALMLGYLCDNVGYRPLMTNVHMYIIIKSLWSGLKGVGLQQEYTYHKGVIAPLYIGIVRVG